MANFCTNCGHALEGAGSFCKYCGAPLSAPAPQPPQQPAQQTAPQQPAYQPTGAWSAPNTLSGQQQAATPQWQQQAATPQWQQPTGEWHTAQRSAGAAGSTGAAGWAATAAEGWNNVRSAIHNPAAAVMNAVDNYENEHLPDASAGRNDPNARIGIPAPGFSDRVNDPELLAALKKQKKSGKRVSAFIVPLPLIGFLIYGAVSDKMEIGQALLYGAVISVIFLICALLGGKKSSGKKPYDAVVVDKQTRQRSRSTGSSNGHQHYQYYTELITVVQTTTGERKKIVENDRSRNQAWDYLQIGERFRYHPEFNFPFELYDKSHAPHLFCAVCEKKNPVTADRCRKCGAPLLK